MDHKLYNMLKEFLENADEMDEETFKENLQEIFHKYNVGDTEYENTPLDDAYEILGKVGSAKDQKQAMKLAKKAYATCNECLDALLLQVSLEENPRKRDQLLEDGLAFEEKRLKKEGYFNEENIGDFYVIFETRPYIKGLNLKAHFLFEDGKWTQAKELCKEILTLNHMDNTGIRYLLMLIYALLEDEKETLAIYRKYHEDNLEMLFPLFLVYYKLGNEKKAIEYLKKITESNPHFVKFFKEIMKDNDKLPEGCYSQGDSSEVCTYFEVYLPVLIINPRLSEFILKHSKKRKFIKK